MSVDRAVLLISGVVPVPGGLAVNGAFGVFAGGIGVRLARTPQIALWLGRVRSAIFAGLAVRLALLSRG